MAAEVQQLESSIFTYFSVFIGRAFSRIFPYRSEGLPERDIESLGVMGWGLAAAENSSAVVAVVVAVAVAPGGAYRGRARFYILRFEGREGGRATAAATEEFLAAATTPPHHARGFNIPSGHPSLRFRNRRSGFE